MEYSFNHIPDLFYFFYRNGFAWLRQGQLKYFTDITTCTYSRNSSIAFFDVFFYPMFHILPHDR